jgi:hypothetical protein
VSGRDSLIEQGPRVEVETERDTNLLTGEEVVRVRYRVEGTRRWTKLVVFPDQGQTVQELLREGHLIAQAHLAKIGATS